MEEIKKIEVQGQQYGVADMLMRSVMGGNAQVIEWSHTHNMNDYKDAGTYRIKGERTGSPMSDNLPIMNSGSGHTIDGVLYVLDSSLPNGSGNADDCTVTQLLVLSNRVGGQEGDMYMRSAYGANKDNLTWKPWEKYQTNMEVGVVTEGNTMNPQNPTQVLEYGYGMCNLTENGIYSGVYLGPKTLIGTTEDPYTMVINDHTAIETFVMVVINNYAAASNARCITQIKFAVTNGGVFSMEKRSTIPGTTDNWSQWESVGSGLPEGIYFNNGSDIDKYYFGHSGVESLEIGSGVAIGGAVRLHSNVKIDEGIHIVGNNLIIDGYAGAHLYIGTGMDVGAGALEVKLGNGTYIGNNVNIEKSQISTTEPSYTVNLFSQQELVESKVNMHGGRITMSYTEHLSNYDDSTGITLRSEGSTAFFSASNHKDFRDDTYSIKRNQMYITDTSFRVSHIEETQDDDSLITTEIAHGITIKPSEDGSKLLFTYNGKSAELPLA